jgi:hypothetical protein
VLMRYLEGLDRNAAPPRISPGVSQSRRVL